MIRKELDHLSHLHKNFYFLKVNNEGYKERLRLSCEEGRE